MRHPSIFIASIALLIPLASQGISSRSLYDSKGTGGGVQQGGTLASGDFNGDGLGDLVTSDPDANDDEGLVFVYFGGSNRNSWDLLLSPEPDAELFGFSIASAGDFDGDGYEDLLVGAPGGSHDGGSLNGAVYLYWGGPDFDAVSDLTFIGAVGETNHGYDVASAGDMNGDGYGDIIVGGSGESGDLGFFGAAHVYFGGSTPNTVADLSDAGTYEGSFFGLSVSSTGDLNGDGFDDVLVGDHGNGNGKVWLYYGSESPDFQNEGWIGGISGTYEGFGSDIAAAGDVNGDGYDDALIGAPNYTDWPIEGRAYILLGSHHPSSITQIHLEDPEESRFGASVSSAGDVNGDGYSDCLIGAPWFDQGTLASVGRTYLYLGGSFVDPNPDLIFTGAAASDYLGVAVVGVPDANGDGYDDIAFGAPGSDASGTDHGRVYVQAVFPYEWISPSAGSAVVAGEEARVRWRGDDIADLALSLDGGTSWSTLLRGVGGRVENQAWISVPSTTARSARIRVSYTNAATTNATSIVGPAFRIVEPHEPPPIAARLAGTATGSTSYGASLVSKSDLNGDGFDDYVIGFPEDGTGGASAGAAHVFFGGPDTDDSPDLIILGNSGDELGTSVALADFDGNGDADLFVGAPGNGDGEARLYLGGPSLDATPDRTLSEPGDGGPRFGAAVAGLGDVNGDGVDDVAITGREDEDDAAYVYFGGVGLDTNADDIIGEPLLVRAAGDIDGDGLRDILTGRTGEIEIYLGNQTDLTRALTLEEFMPADGFGTSFAGGADLNGDGFDEIVVGAPSDDLAGADAGRVYVYFGAAVVDAQPDLVVSGFEAGDELGTAVAIHPDLNGDGYADLLVGAPGVFIGEDNAGRLLVYFGGPAMDERADLSFDGTPGQRLGDSVAPAGDLFDDRFADLLIGAPNNPIAGVQIHDLNRYHLLSPNGGDVWDVGAEVTVSWVGAELADLELSLDGGASYQSLASSVGGREENRQTVRVPHLPTRFADLRVIPHDLNVSGGSTTDASFTIEATISLLRFDLLSDGIETSLAWETDPGPESGIRYRVDRRANGTWELAVTTTDETSAQLKDGPAATYRLVATNGLGDEYVLGERSSRPPLALGTAPNPYREGELLVEFAAHGTPGSAEEIELAVFDVRGRKVATLTRDRFEVGPHHLRWNGRDDAGRRVGSGIYFLRLRSDDRARTLKFQVTR